MKRHALVRHLRRHHCRMLREGRAHTIWENTLTGQAQPLPRHTEIPNQLARKICRELGIPDPPG
ncbi:addiction module toxin, HicA family [Candidatus Entotheonella palauensis]|uniref:addiction module toxin, HicA family n=1 Tax=Candidatus Entotheonella palauensis TaxID=93172 RepID=UPI000B7F85FB|nr:addiction module toxin, HicA family [Candidatus Entotheonella palauensis]